MLCHDNVSLLINNNRLCYDVVSNDRRSTRSYSEVQTDVESWVSSHEELSDFDDDGKISLKKTDDSFASAANYLNKLGWINSNPCFYKVELKKNIPDNYLNFSAKKIHNVKKVKYLKKYIHESSFLTIYDNLDAAIITPDAEIVENANKHSPAFIIFNNYKLILKWNRSLRFALAVCTLKDKFENAL